jgi:type VI protein secretion system component Hcp
MAADDHSDLFMKFVDVRHQHLGAESRTELSSSDPVSKQMLRGFEHKKFLEIDSFSMSAQVDDSTPDEMKRDIMRENQRLIADYEKRRREGKLQPNEQRPKQKSADEVNNDVKTRQNQASQGSPVKEINFTRQVDITSKAFLMGLKQGHGYRSATLIKRKGAGSKDQSGAPAAGDVYLRIDFESVLVTSIDWSDDDGEIKEECKFICKKITIQYRPQLPSGKLGAIKTGSWEYKPPANS